MRWFTVLRYKKRVSTGPLAGTLEVIGKQIDTIKELRGIRPIINQKANQDILNLVV